MDEAAGLGEVAGGDGGGGADVAACGLPVLFPGAVGGLEQHLLAGQALGEGVVDLHGEPFAFGEGALAASGGGQFAAGADQVVDQGALAGGLAFHVQEDGRGQSGHGGGRRRQGRVEAVAGQLEFGDHDQRGHRRDHRDRGPGGQGAQHGVDQRDGAPGEAGARAGRAPPSWRAPRAGRPVRRGGGRARGGRGGGWAAAGGRRPAPRPRAIAQGVRGVYQ